MAAPLSAWWNKAPVDSRLRRSADLVEEAIVEGLVRVEVASAPHVLGDFLSGPARAPGQTRVKSPEEILLLPVPRGNLVRRPGEARRRGEE
jgi:hypothetical protein